MTDHDNMRCDAHPAHPIRTPRVSPRSSSRPHQPVRHHGRITSVRRWHPTWTITCQFATPGEVYELGAVHVSLYCRPHLPLSRRST